jgi:dUTP pyrophosphatase
VSDSICANCRRAQAGYQAGPCSCTLHEQDVIRFVLGANGKAPTRAHQGDAGWDLYVSQDTFILPGTLADVHTDLYVALPPGYWAHLLSRSSTSRRYGLQVVPAVIDNGYRGELFVAVWNMSPETVKVSRHQRLAQIVPHKLAAVTWEPVTFLPDSERGTGGFGSSGT